MNRILNIIIISALSLALLGVLFGAVWAIIFLLALVIEAFAWPWWAMPVMVAVLGSLILGWVFSANTAWTEDDSRGDSQP